MADENSPNEKQNTETIEPKVQPLKISSTPPMRISGGASRNYNGTDTPQFSTSQAAAHYVAKEIERSEAATRWTPEMETLARRSMKKATRLAWQFEAIAEAARQLNNKLSIVSGILGALVGTGGLVGAATPAANGYIGLGMASWPTAISILIGYAISIISVLATNWRLGEIQSKGITAKVGLLNTAREIRWQLAQPAADRADAYEFVYARDAEISHIMAAAPPREDWAREKYRESVGASNADEDALDITPPATPGISNQILGSFDLPNRGSARNTPPGMPPGMPSGMLPGMPSGISSGISSGMLPMSSGLFSQPRNSARGINSPSLLQSDPLQAIALMLKAREDAQVASMHTEAD